jgi:Zn-dependent M28 family amino/carboxypeptidase
LGPSGDRRAGRESDTIYNGARANASATAALLERERVYAKGTKPGRSVLFLP